jgi:hypothetical protein
VFLSMELKSLWVCTEEIPVSNCSLCVREKVWEQI